MFMIRMIGSNSGDFVCTQVLHNLWKLYLCKKFTPPLIKTTTKISDENERNSSVINEDIIEENVYVIDDNDNQFINMSSNEEEEEEEQAPKASTSRKVSSAKILRTPRLSKASNIGNPKISSKPRRSIFNKLFKDAQPPPTAFHLSPNKPIPQGGNKLHRSKTLSANLMKRNINSYVNDNKEEDFYSRNENITTKGQDKRDSLVKPKKKFHSTS
jgi:hypothetical protein